MVHPKLCILLICSGLPSRICACHLRDDGVPLLPSVQRHAVGLHADLFLDGSEDFFVGLAAFFGLACDEVEVGGCVGEDLVDKVYYEFHVLFNEAA